jgi:hypothetical protein
MEVELRARGLLTAISITRGKKAAMPSEVINLAKGRAFDLSFPTLPARGELKNAAEGFSDSWQDTWACA